MLLTLDIGNTNITLGVFEGAKLVASWRLATDPRRMPDEYGLAIISMLPLKNISPKQIHHIALCSVVAPLVPVFEEVSLSYFEIQPLVVGAGVKTGVKVLYDNPRDVGADRVTDAAAAYQLYGGPTIIVDFGTATVFDAVSESGDYLGGAIAPGLNLAAEALFLNTSQLRRVEMARPSSAIGKNTTASMQSGLVLGYAGLVEGMVDRFKKELGGDATVVATGGLAPLMAQEVNVFTVINLDLTIIGLQIIHELNQRQE